MFSLHFRFIFFDHGLGLLRCLLTYFIRCLVFRLKTRSLPNRSLECLGYSYLWTIASSHWLLLLWLLFFFFLRLRITTLLHVGQVKVLLEYPDQFLETYHILLFFPSSLLHTTSNPLNQVVFGSLHGFNTKDVVYLSRNWFGDLLTLGLFLLFFLFPDPTIMISRFLPTRLV